MVTAISNPTMRGISLPLITQTFLKHLARDVSRLLDVSFTSLPFDENLFLNLSSSLISEYPTFFVPNEVYLSHEIAKTGTKLFFLR